MVGSINLNQQMLQLQYTNKELFSPSYNQTADEPVGRESLGTKPLCCLNPLVELQEFFYVRLMFFMK
jgi:hypothetical protein